MRAEIRIYLLHKNVATTDTANTEEYIAARPQPMTDQITATRVHDRIIVEYGYPASYNITWPFRLYEKACFRSDRFFPYLLVFTLHCIISSKCHYYA